MYDLPHVKVTPSHFVSNSKFRVRSVSFDRIEINLNFFWQKILLAMRQYAEHRFWLLEIKIAPGQGFTRFE
jgi:hypothetical protein